jgi:hypothetical protein
MRLLCEERDEIGNTQTDHAQGAARTQKFLHFPAAPCAVIGTVIRQMHCMMLARPVNPRHPASETRFGSCCNWITQLSPFQGSACAFKLKCT